MAKAKNFMEDAPEELLGDDSQHLPAPRESGALLNPSTDNLDLEGVRPPYLTVTHGVGEAAEHFNPGDLILAKENLVCPKGRTIDAIILNVDQYFKQRVSNDDWTAGVRPAKYSTKAEAREAGLQTEWVDNVGPDVSPAMDLTLLLRKPEGVDCGLFGIDIGDGHEYAICLLSVDKSGYNPLLNDFAMIAKTKLKATGLFSAAWEIRSELGKPSKKGNRVQTVRMKFKEMLTPETVAGIKSALAAPSNG